MTNLRWPLLVTITVLLVTHIAGYAVFYYALQSNKFTVFYAFVLLQICELFALFTFYLISYDQGYRARKREVWLKFTAQNWPKELPETQEQNIPILKKEANGLPR